MIHFFGGADELPNASAGYAEADANGWWSNLQQYGATIALATALTLAASTAALATQVFSFHQDDPAGNLTAGQFNDYDWQDPRPPFLAPAIVPAPFGWHQDDPAGNLSAGQFNDYDWQNPVPPAQYFPPQLITDDVIIVPQPATFQPDEDFWQNPVAPQWPTYQQLFNQEDDVPALYGQFDEDFWQNQVPPQLCAYQPQPFQWDAAEIIPQPVSFQPDEDFCLNLSPPSPPTYVYPMPWTFDAPEIVPQPSTATRFIAWIADDFG
jgi:hypothetical protein